MRKPAAGPSWIDNRSACQREAGAVISSSPRSEQGIETSVKL
jgi:hypothetical protein